MVPVQAVFCVVLGLGIVSAAAAITIAVVVDARKRPVTRRVVDRLMQIALLAAGAIVASLGTSGQP